jgi:hypothetical protein
MLSSHLWEYSDRKNDLAMERSNKTINDLI